MNLKQQLEMQRAYDRRVAGQPKRATEAARTMVNPDEMSRAELIDFLEGVGIEVDRRWGVARLREVMRGKA